MLQSLRTGNWLNRERLRAYPLILLAGLMLALAYLIATRVGLMDRFDRPLGTDFSQVWAAGGEVLQGQAQMPYDNLAHAERQRDIFGPKTQFYGWHYPPFFLIPAAVLATMPYLVALLVWQGVTLALYLTGIGAILRQKIQPVMAWIIPALAFPAVFVNLGHGHNGFLTAALLTGALVFLDRKPWLAGMLFGLLAYKPQFALIVPVALVAGGYWRVLFGAAATVTGMVLATLILFGTGVWQSFFASLEFTRQIVLEQGGTGFEKIQTVFAAVRLMGMDVQTAYAAQTLATGATMLAIAWLWRSGADFKLKSAALLAASLLTTPYALDYDMMVLGPAIAFMVVHGMARGFAPFEKSLLAALWLVPLLARVTASFTRVPIGVLVLLVFFVCLLVRAVSEQRERAFVAA